MFLIVAQMLTSNKLLGYVRRSSREISSTRTRRTLYLAVVRSALGYASQVWSPQFISLIKRTERIQRRASKFMLNLPYLFRRLIVKGLYDARTNTNMLLA